MPTAADSHNTSRSWPAVWWSIALMLVLGGCTGSPAPANTTIVATTTQPTVDMEENAGADALLDQIRLLVAAAEEVRGLRFVDEPKITILDAAEFDARVAALLEEELDLVDIAVDEQVVELLAMMDPNVDLASLLFDLYSEQIAGFYDGDTRELVVPISEELSVLDKVTLVHELIHGLTDMHFAFYDRLTSLVDEGRYDEARALQALIEGDATYFQLQYMLTLPPGELIQAGLDSLATDTIQLESAPAFIAADLLFPYEEGFTFVERVVDAGGIAAVDRAYDRPPTTTEHILHPERYFSTQAVRETGAAANLVGWVLHESGQFGEWQLRQIFLGTEEAGLVSQIGDGWGGDEHFVYTRGNDVVFAYYYVGDTEQDTIEVTQALIRHASAAMSLGEAVGDGLGVTWELDGVFAAVDRRDDALVFVAATDATAGKSILEALRP